MELQIAGTNIELAPAVRQYVESKISKLSKHLPGIIESKVEISEEKTRSPQQHYLVRVTVNSGVGGAVFHGEDRGEDLFKAVDGVASIMIRQLERHKGKLYEKGRGNSLARGDFEEVARQARPTAKVVKTKRFLIEPMTVDEAAEQMEILGHSFFLFFDAKAGEVRLLYRRNDGNYGLIEPEMV